MRSPVNNPVITSDYGNRLLFGKEQFHNGIDFISRESNIVYAIGDGECVYDKDDYNHDFRFTRAADSAGNYVIVRHWVGDSHVFVRYLHLCSNLLNRGDSVFLGDAIGKYGDYGFSFGPHVHIDVYDKDWKIISPYDVEEIKVMLEEIKNG